MSKSEYVAKEEARASVAKGKAEILWEGSHIVSGNVIKAKLNPKKTIVALWESTEKSEGQICQAILGEDPEEVRENILVMMAKLAQEYAANEIEKLKLKEIKDGRVKRLRKSTPESQDDKKADDDAEKPEGAQKAETEGMGAGAKTGKRGRTEGQELHGGGTEKKKKGKTSSAKGLQWSMSPVPASVFALPSEDDSD